MATPWIRSMAILLGGAALGCLVMRGLEPRPDDGAVIASLAEARAELRALERRVSMQPRPVVSATTAAASSHCVPAPEELDVPDEPADEAPPLDTAAATRIAHAEDFVRTSIANRVWTDAHRDQWLALQSDLDATVRDRLLQDLMVSANRQELRLETTPGPSF